MSSEEIQILNSLGPLNSEKSLRYKAFLTASIPPLEVEKLVGEHLPPASLMDGSSRDRVLLSLATAAKVFAVDVLESAMELRERGDGGGVSKPLSPGQLNEAWRRMMLEGRVLGVGKSVECMEKIKEDAVKALTANKVGGGSLASHAPSHT